MKNRRFAGISGIAAASLVLIALIATIGTVVIADNVIAINAPGTTTTITNITTVAGSQNNNNLVVNQKPVTDHFTLTWELSPEALQDRFTPFNIVVAQGDTVRITFVVNDSSAHTFTIGSPYNYQINVTVPGLRNDLTGQTFTTNATNNSPGVVISGTPGNLTGTGSFVAKYAGVFEYYCVYHVQIGMFGYLTVLPNSAYNGSATTTTTSSTSTSTNASNPLVSIEYGSAANTVTTYYSPPTITVVIGVNNTVTWVNNDIAPHTVTANDGSFNSGNMNPGQSWTHVFTTPGNYTYHCNYHQWMQGTIIVKS
ncbi:MAG: cupredoxin domain-containing protein [Nitrososphaerota archaeon]|nr:cupredoxin domain-containing protein [Nitrososphaerota archaeon]MDG6924287.1 cupredoxin domain-containing protein [Nitrososphaerota archaeon]